MNSQTLDINNQQIWCETMGDSENPACLLIAGAGAHAHFWGDTFCTLLVDAGYFVIRYDHRDVALSSTTDFEKNPYDLIDLAKDAVGILDAFNLKKAHLVGHSMGGYIAQLMAAEYPERLLSMTLIAAGPAGGSGNLFVAPLKPERDQMKTTWEVLMGNQPTDSFEESIDGYMKVWHYLNGEVALDQERARAYTQEFYTRSKQPVGPHKPHMNVMQRAASSMKDRLDLFSKIKAPTLIIQGEVDYLIFPSNGGDALARAMPQATYKKIAKMGHLFFSQELEKELASLVTSFWHSSC